MGSRISRCNDRPPRQAGIRLVDRWDAAVHLATTAPSDLKKLIREALLKGKDRH
jgi:hypothetical protein